MCQGCNPNVSGLQPKCIKNLQPDVRGAAAPCARGCNRLHHKVALLLLEAGADPYAAPHGGESAVDALRRIGGKASMELHSKLTSRGAALVAVPAGGGGAAAAVAAAVGVGGGEAEDDEEGEEEGEEEEGEGEEDEDEAEREAAKTLAASAPKVIMLPSVHPHPLELCAKGNYCDQRGSGCNFYPTAYSCIECSWDICQACARHVARTPCAPRRCP